MLIEATALAAAAAEGGTAIEGAAVAEGAVEGAAVAEGTVNILEQADKIPNILENIESIEESAKVLEPSMSDIQEVTLDAIEQSNIEKAAAKVDETIQKLRELTEEEKQKLREEHNLPENLLKAIRVDEAGNYYVKCTNEKYNGLEHPETGIPFTEKTIEINGVKITVVVPEFPCLFETDIPPEIWTKGDAEVFKHCTEKLRDYLNEHPEQKANFTPDQLRMIEKGMPRIPGLTWHHNEIPGKMQLVDFKIHDKTGHTGGNHLWGGGIR